MAKKRGLADRLVEALQKRGCPIIQSRTVRFTVLQRTVASTADAKDTYWFVGKAGALRYGYTTAASWNAGQALKDKLLATVPE